MIRILLAFVCAAGLAAAEASMLVNTNAMDEASAPVVAEAEHFRARITVQNPNDVAVRIDKLDATCSCAVLEVVDRFLLPHATTELVMEVDNANRSDIQRIGVSVYLTDPDLEPIEVVALWNVRAHVQVDVLSIPGIDPLARPPRAYQDIYRFPSKVRPDELHKLRKRIRLSCPAGEAPEGGLQVTGVEYAGPLWAFTPTVQSDGSVLLDGKAKDGAVVADGIHDEAVVVLTNHPKKPRIPLVFITYVGKDAGAVTFDPDAKRGEEVKLPQPGPANE